MKQATSARRVLLGVTGSIAAYKAAELVRLFKRRGWDVSVVMTRAATEFVGELTFRTLSQNPVGVDMFQATTEWQPDHISRSDWAEVLVIAPCTANVMAKMANGLADDLLTCTALACQAPIVVAPAMNEKMWTHAATRRNVEVLTNRGVHVMGVGRGDLACGYQGSGRMSEPDEIVKIVEGCLAATEKGKCHE
jgi:phosphopantothenoylcysteine decarboxylase/phosphopantothenate--cysteine ligase